MSKTVTFSTFWEQRNYNNIMILDCVTTNNASVFIAFICYKLGMTANQLSLASGIFSAFAFLAALFLPPDQIFLSVAAIYLLSQVSYLFDSADGQLARATKTTSEFGAFLDLGIDISSMIFGLGSIFIYAYRHFKHIDFIDEADLFLLVGFLFMGARTSAFFVWQLFSISFPEKYHATKSKPTRITLFLMSIMGQQFSVFNMLMILLWPMICLNIFAAQAVILGAVYVRYFSRARPT
jgi:phosphatidylglycerophosphate synthase